MRKYVLSLLTAIAFVCAFVVFVPSVQAATETLNGNMSELAISANTELDLNGYSIDILTIDSGVTVTLKDTQTDDYNSSNGRGYGRITTVLGDGTLVAADGYLLLEDNGVSAHKLNLRVSGASLRVEDSADVGAGMYYRCTFGGDEVVKNNIVAYGVAMGAGRMPDFFDRTYTRNTDVAAWSTGATFTDNSAFLRGVLMAENSLAMNQHHSELDVYCQAYVELADGSRVTGEAVSFNLRDLVEGTEKMEGVEEQFRNLDDLQKASAKKLYDNFSGVISTWHIPRIRHSSTGTYWLCVPSDLHLLKEDPAADYILKNDLDMASVNFDTVNVFSGSFDGNDKTLSNLVVDPDSGNCIGMFAEVGTDGTIFDLNLENITVDACGTDARFVGTIAGKTYGTIKNCTVTGTILHDRVATETTKVFIGAFVGKSEAGSVTTGGTSLSVVDTVTDVNGKTVTYTTTGLCAKVKMNVPDSPYMIRRLVGNSSTGGTASGDWQDLSFSTEDDSALVQSRRETAVKAMHEMGTFKWTVPNLTNSGPDLIHYGTTDTKKMETHIHTQKFYSGTTYYGIPYNHTSSSYEQAMAYMDEGANGVYVLNDEAASAGNSTWNVRTEDSFGNMVTRGFTQYIGNDCSGAVAWAWHHAVPRWVAGGGVYVLLSGDMMPNDAAEKTYGIYRVGPYTVTNKMTAVVNKQNVVTTPAVAQANGETMMYESYARTQMGDGLVYGEPGGHARLVAADSVVIRNAQGAINANKSYMLIHEQGDGLYDRATTNSSWRINYKYTFNELYNGKSRSTGKGYLPITLQGYHDETVPVMSTSPYEYTTGGVERITTPALGQINAGNRILCATVTVKDSAGKVVYEKTAYKGSNGLYNAYRSTYLTMIMKYYFSDYVNYVTRGQTYTFSVDCTVAGGTLNADGTISNTAANVIKDRAFTAA